MPASNPRKPNGIVMNINQMADPSPLPPSLHMFPPGGVARYAIASGENANSGLRTVRHPPMINSVLLALALAIYYSFSYGDYPHSLG